MDDKCFLNAVKDEIKIVYNKRIPDNITDNRNNNQNDNRNDNKDHKDFKESLNYAKGDIQMTPDPKCDSNLHNYNTLPGMIIEAMNQNTRPMAEHELFALAASKLNDLRKPDGSKYKSNLNKVVKSTLSSSGIFQKVDGDNKLWFYKEEEAKHYMKRTKEKIASKGSKKCEDFVGVNRNSNNIEQHEDFNNNLSFNLNDNLNKNLTNNLHRNMNDSLSMKMNMNMNNNLYSNRNINNKIIPLPLPLPLPLPSHFHQHLHDLPIENINLDFDLQNNLPSFLNTKKQRQTHVMKKSLKDFDQKYTSAYNILEDLLHKYKHNKEIYKNFKNPFINCNTWEDLIKKVSGDTNKIVGMLSVYKFFKPLSKIMKHNLILISVSRMIKLQTAKKKSNPDVQHLNQHLMKVEDKILKIHEMFAKINNPDENLQNSFNID